ncbi:MAG: PorT family protein [Bacteroidales bacterium]|nr:PorT family protein [Bacteroidales bacterium]MCL2133321.1 PorT family protein [Bacteroidales bacterium]
MKKVVFITMFLACHAVSYAQINYGVEIGGGFSNMRVSNPNVTEKFGFRGGFNLSILTNSVYYFETGIAYERKGAKLTGFIPHYAENVRNMNVAFDYVEIPLLFGFKTRKKSALTWKWGFYFAYGFGGSGRIAFDDGSGQLFEEKITNVFKDQSYVRNGETYAFRPFSRWDIGAKLGYDWRIFNRFSIGLYGSIGLLNLGQPDDKRMSNASGIISVRYAFK